MRELKSEIIHLLAGLVSVDKMVAVSEVCDKFQSRLDTAEAELAIPEIRPCPKCGTSDVKCHGLIWTCCECGTDWTFNPYGGEA